MSSLCGERQIILVSTRFKKNDNIMTLAWHMHTSFKPELYAISVGKTRFSNHIIKNSRCFCINFMPVSLKKEILHCGSCSGKEHDKFSETNLEKEECKTINCPRIKQASAYAECKLIKSIETGDHTIFIGKILKSKINKSGKRFYQ